MDSMKGVGRIASGLLFLCLLLGCSTLNTRPIFDQTSYGFDVPEESPAGTFVGRVTATDSEDDVLLYSITTTTDDSNHFNVNATTGIISIAAPVDRESLFSATLRIGIRVADEELDATVQVIITFTDINDNNPVFTNLPHSIVLFEDSRQATSIYRVDAEDNDLSRNAALLYSLLPNDTFSIDPSNGQITQSATLDYDRGAREYRLIITVEDRAEENPLQAVSFLTISVEDVDDLPPVFDQLSYVVQIHENFTMGSRVIEVNARDQDEGINDDIVYSITGGNSIINGTPSFSINDTTGWISVNVSSLDREEQAMYTLEITGTERTSINERTATTTVDIIILDINDHVPVFEEQFYQVNVSELEQLNSTVLSLVATDLDEEVHGTFVFTLVNVTDEEELPFMVTSETIQNTGTAYVTLAQELDYEIRRSYRFMVVATETVEQEIRRGFAIVMVYVDNENDNNPFFEQEFYPVDIDENLVSGTIVQMVTAFDGDDGDFGELSFGLSDADSGKPFRILTLPGGYGEISTTEPLDFERVESYSLTVIVEDGADTPNTNFTTVNVTVINLNDNSPVFVDEAGQPVDTVTHTLFEEIDFPFTVFTLQAIDLDSPLNELTFSIASDSPPLGHFAIDEENVNTAITLDFDLNTATQFYTLNISVNDTENAEYLIVNIELVDINDNSPEFANDSYSFDLVENSEIGTLIGTVEAMDIDSGTFGEIEYTLYGNDTDSFHVNSSTGEIYLSTTIDREETPGPLMFTVIASDLDSNITQRNEDTTSVTIYVLDRNDNTPMFLQEEYTFNVSENTGQLLSEFRVFANDRDEGNNAVVMYTFTEGNEENAFLLDSSTGVITRNTSTSLDYERTQRYDLIVLAEDSGNSSNMAMAQVVIDILDLNDESPTFSMADFNASITENTLPGSSVTTVTATDEDSGELGRVIYSITDVQGPTEPNGTFMIESNTGIVRTEGYFDRERFSGTYVITVMVRDNGTVPQQASTTLTVDILDINDETPVFGPVTMTPPPEEEQEPGYVVATFEATDGDEPNTNNSLITFSIASIVPITPVSFDPSVNYDDHFGLNISSSGDVEIITGVSLDYENIISYSISVIARDNGDPFLYSEMTVNVTVVDINDNAPRFDSSTYTREISENAIASTIITFVARDEDSTSNGMITYVPSNLSSFPTPFLINGDSLVVRPDTLDFEMAQSYRFNVTAIDGGMDPLSDETQVEIFVLDLNDNSPIFDPMIYSTDVDEGDYTVNSSVIAIINATDIDSTNFGNVSYEVFPANELFSVTKLESGEGEVRVKGILDREALDEYTITIIARDGGSPPETGTTTVTVSVIDVNDNNPVLNEEQYTATIPEGATPQQVASTLANIDVSAEDEDLGRNSQVSFFLTNDTDFTIDVSTGTIQSRRVFDYEVERSFDLVIIAVDNGTNQLNDSALVTIYITDVNDNAPSFIDFPFDLSYDEDTEIGSVIANISANDNDFGINAQLVFQLANDEGRFSIDSDGYITLVSGLDRESTSSYNLTVTVSDRGQPLMSATDYLYIEVTDVNDVAPQLERDSYNFLVPENVDLNSTLGTVVAFDLDEESNGNISFEIVSGDTNIFFLRTMQTDSRQTFTAMILNDRIFDYEAETSYSLSILASNTVPPYFNTTADVIITIRDTNDNAPEFSVNDGYVIIVPEGAVIQRPVGTVVATDADGGLNGTVEYFFVDQTEQEVTDTFAIDVSSGVITLISSLNFESRNQYEFYVEARDLSDAPLTSNVSVVVNIEDTNENAPVFDTESYSASVPENVPPGNVVTRVNATESETGGSSVRYSLVAGEIQRFQIDDVTGVITTNATLDREEQESYVLTVQARDMATLPLSSFVQVLVQVTDANDNDPMFGVTSVQVSLPESSAVGVRLPEVFLATDIDIGANAEISYSITPESFTVNPITGVISVQDSAPLDRETTPVINLLLRATDGGTNPRSSTLPIEVTLDDINDNTPTFLQDSYLADVFENSEEDVSVAMVTATDADVQSLRYEIESGDDVEEKFRIDEMSGLIETTAIPLDRESRDTYTLVVSVTDSGIPSRVDTATVTVAVVDVNEYDPRCAQSLFTFSTVEANELQVELGLVTATDDDVPGQSSVGSGELTYQLVSNDLQSITISSMGVVFGEPGLDFDSLTDGSFTFEVLVSDQPADALTQRSTTCQVMVTLTDANDNLPIFDQSLYEASVREDATDDVITQVNAEDSDSGTNGDITYSFQSDVSVFAIDSLTGVVRVSGSLDSDTQDSYLLEIIARDEGVPSRIGITMLSVVVLDVNDNSPRFGRSLFEEQVSEGASPGDIVATVIATDSDSTDLTYSITVGNVDDDFSIVSGNGVIQVLGALDRERMPVYTLVIVAEDDAGNTGTTQVRVVVTDINDETPQFQQTQYTARIDENSLEGTQVLPFLDGTSVRILAIDDDEPNTPNSQVVYTLTGVNAGEFNIDRTSGIVTVARGAVLNYEDDPTIALSVVATDSDPDMPTSSTVTLFVNLNDVNDVPPRFSSPFGYTLIVMEDQAVGSVINSQISATDPDPVGGMVRYTLTNADPFSALGQFSINRTTGILSLTRTLDRESDSTLSLVVTASDMGEPSLSSVVNVLITVEDVNDNAPRFDQDIYTTTVPEFLARGEQAFQVTAMDPDALGPNSRIVYEVIGSNTFIINNEGIITINEDLDYESERAHTFTVEACDSSPTQLCGSTIVRINVEDFNDEVPLFDQTIYTTDVCFSTAANGMELVQPVATDQDSGNNAELTYTLLDSSSLLTVDPTNGRISFAQSLSSTDIQTHTATIVAEDSGATPLSGSAQVAIRVLNCTEQEFYFISPFNYFTIEEEENLFVGGSSSLEIGISLVAQDVSFDQNPVTNPFTNILNNIQLKSFDDLLENLRGDEQGLDREARHLYTIILEARDNNQQVTFTSVTLEVLDVNDNDPMFPTELVVFSVSENQTTPFVIGSVPPATDEDAGTNADIEYRVTSVDPTSDPLPFSIEPISGEISADVELDREEEDNYRIVIEATDGVRSTTVPVLLTVLDVNDCQPDFIEEEYTFDISESIPSGSSVGTVMATDCDQDDNAVLRYTIADGDFGVFELDMITGVIRTSSPLDFEQRQEYILTVTATDLGLPIPLSGTVSVVFTVEDFNECPPEFQVLNPEMPVAEDAGLRSVVYTFTVQDCDSDLNGVDGARFSIIAGNEEGVFEIDPISGVVTTVALLDREQENMYILTVQAMDSAVNPRSSTTELRVSVTDVNDNSPVFSEEDTEISITVTEGEGLGQTLLTVTATDADTGLNSQIEYLLVEGGEDIFAIDETTGSLSLVQTLDREINDSYVLRVVARDLGAEPRSSNATSIFVTVSDENDNDPEILNIASGVTVALVDEGSDVGTVVFIVNATDEDLGVNSNIRFFFDDRSNELPFNIVDGVIGVTGILDFETQIIYSLVVVAEDNGSPVARRGIATLVVQVTDRNDNPPVFVEEDYSAQQAEGEDVGTSILRVQANDADQSNTDNSRVAYYINPSSADGVFFSIDNMTGIISNAEILDREERSSYTFEVMADNYLSDVTQIGRVMATITIGDINDETPIFSQKIYSVSIPEDKSTGSVILTVSATDNDLENTPNSELIFSLDRVMNVPFFINSTTGVLSLQNQLDYEQDTFYDFDVIVEDKSTSPLRNRSVIRVTITDVNDQPPMFTMPSYLVSLQENSTAQQILFLNFTDEDDSFSHKISVLFIEPGTIEPADGAEGLFSITGDGSSTGAITVSREVDFEMVQSYRFTIVVTNINNGAGEGCPSQELTCRLSSTAQVTVQILDGNDNSPVFLQNEYIGEVSSTALTGTSILSVAATDADTTQNFRTVLYRLVTNPDTPFRISETTGTIFTRGSFEGLDGDMYTLNVFAFDNNGNEPSNEAMTTVNLIVLNDFQRIAIVFNVSVDTLQAKQDDIVMLLSQLSGYDIVVEQYREYSTDTETTFIFHAVDSDTGNIIDFNEFLTGQLENLLFTAPLLQECRILRIQSFGDLILTQGPVDTETVVILVLCLFLIIGAIIVLVTAFSQRYLALHAARHKLLADVFYGSHAGSSIGENIHQENIQLQLIDSTGQGMNKQNPMFVHPYDNWAGVDTSGVESVGGDSNLQRDNPLYESQEIRMEMFADVTDDDDDGDEADEAELLAAALQDDSDGDDEDNSVTAI